MASNSVERPKPSPKGRKSPGSPTKPVKLAKFMPTQIRKLNILYPFLTADQIRKRAKTDWQKYQSSTKYRGKVKTAVDVIRNSPRKQKDETSTDQNDKGECSTSSQVQPFVREIKFSALDKVKAAFNDVINNSPRKQKIDPLPVKPINFGVKPLNIGAKPLNVGVKSFNIGGKPVNNGDCCKAELTKEKETAPVVNGSAQTSDEKKDAFDALLQIPNTKPLVNVTPIKTINKQLWPATAAVEAPRDDDDEVYDNSSDSDYGCELQVRHDSFASDSSSEYVGSRDNSPVRGDNDDGSQRTDGPASKKRKVRRRTKRRRKKAANGVKAQSNGATESSQESGTDLFPSPVKKEKLDQKLSIEMRRIQQLDSDFVQKAREMLSEDTGGSRGSRSSSRLNTNSTKYPLRATKFRSDQQTPPPKPINAKQQKKKKVEVPVKTDSESQSDYSLFSSPKSSVKKLKEARKEATPKSSPSKKKKQTKISSFFAKNATSDSSSQESSSPAGKILDSDHLWSESSELEGSRNGSVITGRTYGVKRKRKEEATSASSSQSIAGLEQEPKVPSSDSSVRRSVRSTAGTGLSAILSSLKSSRSPAKVSIPRR